MKDTKVMCLFLMVMAILLFIVGGMAKDFSLMGCGAMLLALASFYHTEYRIEKLREEIKGEPQQ